MEGLVAQGLEKWFKRRKAVDDVSLDIQRGEVVGLLGPNGAGKTTSFYMMVGLLPAGRGRIFLEADEITGLPMYQRCRRGVGYLPQESSVFRKLTVEENILAILETQDFSRAERRARLAERDPALGHGRAKLRGPRLGLLARRRREALPQRFRQIGQRGFGIAGDGHRSGVVLADLPGIDVEMDERHTFGHRLHVGRQGQREEIAAD